MREKKYYKKLRHTYIYSIGTPIPSGTIKKIILMLFADLWSISRYIGPMRDNPVQIVPCVF